MEDGYGNSALLGWGRSCLETLYCTGRAGRVLCNWEACQNCFWSSKVKVYAASTNVIMMWARPFWELEIRIKRQNNYFQLYEDLTHIFCPLFSVKGKVEVRNGYFWSGDSQVVAKMFYFLWTAPLLLYRTCGFSNWHNRCWSKCKPKCSHFGQENPISIEFWKKSLWEQS